MFQPLYLTSANRDYYECYCKLFLCPVLANMPVKLQRDIFISHDLAPLAGSPLNAGVPEAHGVLLPAKAAETLESGDGNATVQASLDLALLDALPPNKHEQQQQGHGLIGSILTSDALTPWSSAACSTADTGVPCCPHRTHRLRSAPRIAPGPDPIPLEDATMPVAPPRTDVCASEDRRGTWDAFPAMDQTVMSQNLEDALEEALSPGSRVTPADVTTQATVAQDAATPTATPSHVPDHSARAPTNLGNGPGHDAGAALIDNLKLPLEDCLVHTPPARQRRRKPVHSIPGR